MCLETHINYVFPSNIIRLTLNRPGGKVEICQDFTYFVRVTPPYSGRRLDQYWGKVMAWPDGIKPLLEPMLTCLQ